MYQIMKTRQRPMTQPRMMVSRLLRRLILFTKLLISGNLLDKSFNLVCTACNVIIVIYTHNSIFIYLQNFPLINKVVSGLQSNVYLFVNHSLGVSRKIFCFVILLFLVIVGAARGIEQ